MKYLVFFFFSRYRNLLAPQEGTATFEYPALGVECPLGVAGALRQRLFVWANSPSPALCLRRLESWLSLLSKRLKERRALSTQS